MDVVLCKSPCFDCFSDIKCRVCELNYFNHKGNCLEECPSHSKIIGANCIDFEEETSKTTYNFKDFMIYLMMILEQMDNFL